MRESEFQDQVIELAHLHGWLVAHFRPAQTAKGWRTPVSADGKGFPDLVMARRGYKIFAELKVNAKLSDDQRLWLDALGPTTDRCLVVLWRPEYWPQIEAALKFRRWGV